MASLPPKIDQRTYEEIVHQTESLVEQFTDWKPAPEGKTDAGRALIRIFGRMVKVVSDRLNQVPEKNFLAFLNLIGGELKPPQPATVPLTFYLAQGSTTDGLVPAHTQVSAPPAEGSEAEIVFETDRELVVTTTQLQAVFLREPDEDKYRDCTLEATGQNDAAFWAFVGDRPIPHSLYITCPEIFDLPELKELKLTITTNSINQFQSLPLNWSYWDGSQWQAIATPSISLDNNQSTITFTFANLPIPTLFELQGKTAKWLQAKLTNISSLSANLPQITNLQGSIKIKQSNLIPEVCLFNATPLDLTKDFYPFGEQPGINDTFYIALHDAFIKPDATITIDISLARQLDNINDLKIIWEIGNGQIWREIADKNNQVKWVNTSSIIQFIEKDIQAKLKFPNRENLPNPSTVNGETRYWIRARIIQGHYGKAASERTYPVYDDLAIIRKEILKDNNVIEVDTLDLFKENDKIRILPLKDGFPEENQINAIDKNGNKLTLKNKILNNKLEIGTRIMRKSIITETIPPTYDPPLIKSLTVTYDFTIEENAIYCAENDFIYSYPGESFQAFTPTIDKEPSLYLGFDQSFNNKTVTLYAQVEAPSPDELSADITTATVITELARDKTLQLADVTGWRKGDRLQIQNPINPQQYDNYTISDISGEQVTINQPLPQDYPQNTPVLRPQQPQLVWEYSSPLGWQSLGVNDETQAFSQRGLIQFIAPADFSPTETFGKQLYWLRVRWVAGNFRVKPRLRRLLTNTTWAVQAISLKEEVLGSSNYEPNQIFVANNTPILMGEQLEVQEGQIPSGIESNRIKVIADNVGEIEEVWILWQEVADFYGSSASDRHYILDRQTGEIRFGNGQAGMIPPRGRNNIRLSFYRTGGGKQGNVTTQTISQLKTTIPYIDRVINLEAAGGGAQQETLERLKARVPKQLRHRDRAVTLEDIADLAYEASTDVARVKVVTPDLLTANFSPLNERLWLDPTKPDVTFADTLSGKLQGINSTTEAANFQEMLEEINRRAGQVKLIILPQSSDRLPTPSLALLEQVETYIRSRCEATVDLVVTAPRWQEVSVTATITPVSLENADMVINIVKQTLETFLHPLTGGTGAGWQFGRYPQKSDFYAIIQSISGVDHVNSLEVNLPSSLTADSLIYSGNHIVKAIGNRQ
ncbi:Baseplate J-like protein [Nostoc sp. PCC 7524]|uniref:baseplate J/gp47 family protein n=1 Tax=Nostoc sp. (strain ATCC 29411 / PCC 7524) TaxID=28072 RepID=UPI00029F0AE0|nr:baseplate J/gp47 family protein [Nostoc sp. PCC 7524]AFY47148.1 Baseplate J-like protein [Nostoc sp. PCC 7524]